ncbi:MAG: hypothetical protein RI885_800 [Actinomycetota bacterium]|jgi:uncharacterized membrane protein YdbT with pleckstrin-like domain
MAKPTPIASLTTLPKSPTDDRKQRMNRYLIAMAVRLVCIGLCFVVQGWWLAVFAAGAVVLPYLAVVLANVGHESPGKPLRPGAIVPVTGPAQPGDGRP